MPKDIVLGEFRAQNTDTFAELSKGDEDQHAVQLHFRIGPPQFAITPITCRHFRSPARLALDKGLVPAI